MFYKQNNDLGGNFLRVAIYCRLSDEDREKQGKDSESIQNQKSMLLDYAFKMGWNVYDIYCDENYSGIDGERPEYNRLLKDAEERCFDIILCKTQSRFSRNMEHIERYLNGKLQEWGIRFVGLLDNVDTGVKHNKKARQINGLINEWYLEDLSENVRAVLHHKHTEGKCTRAFLPYGLKKSPEDRNKILIDDAAAKVVKEIFDNFLKGLKIAEIAEKLNRQKIPSPQEYKKITGEKLNIPKRNPDGCWTAQSVLRILQNPMYAGDLVHNIYTKPSYKSKKVIKNHPDKWIIKNDTHEPIINREVFEKVKEKLNKSTFPPIECGVCGGAMKIKTNKVAGKQYSYIRCCNCGLSVNKKFIEKFLDEKYKGRVEKVVLNSKYGARILFYDF